MITKKNVIALLSAAMFLGATLTTQSITGFADSSKSTSSSGLLTDVTDDVTDDVYNVYLSGTVDYSAAYEVLDYVNEERERLGLNTLTMDSSLLETAQQRAAETALLFSHERPDGSSCYTAFENKYSYANAENIASGQMTPKAVITSWFNSPGHYANIINSNFNSIGIGCFVASDGYIYWTQVFSSDEASDPSLSGSKTQTFKIATTLDTLSLDMKLNKVDDFTYQVKITNTNQNFMYSSVEILPESFDFVSSDKNVAIVDSTGKVTFSGYGTADIEVYLHNDSDYIISSSVEFKKDGVAEEIGDITGDGSVDVRDAVLVLKDYARAITGISSSLDKNIADVNCDGIVDSIDATFILIYYAHKIVDPDLVSFDNYIIDYITT